MAGFLSKKRVSSKCSINNEILQGTVSRMFIVNIFKFIVHSFNDSAFSEPDFVPECHQPVFHIASDTGYKVNASLIEYASG